jgi:membrane protease YdiL (CAAX protease family)
VNAHEAPPAMLDTLSARDHLLAALLALVSPWIDVALYPWLTRATRAGRPWARTIAYLFYLTLAWGYTALVVRHWTSEQRAWYALGLRAGPGIGIALGIALVFSYLALALRARNKIAGSQEGLARLRRAFGRGEPLMPHTKPERLLFALVAISAGCVEEFLYRGFLGWYFTTLWGPVAALLASAAVFGLGHAYLGRAHVVRTAVVGLLLGLVVLASGSLWPAIAIHAAMDLVAGDLGWRAFARADLAPSIPAPAAR